jgi:hypothetical protein
VKFSTSACGTQAEAQPLNHLQLLSDSKVVGAPPTTENSFSIILQNAIHFVLKSPEQQVTNNGQRFHSNSV